MYCNVICGEYFDLVRTVEVIDHTLYINGLAFVGACLNEIALCIVKNGGADIYRLTIDHTVQGECALGRGVIGGGVGIHDLQVLHFDGSTQGHFCVALGDGFAFIAGDEDIAVKSVDGMTEFVFTLKLADK